MLVAFKSLTNLKWFGMLSIFLSVVLPTANLMILVFLIYYFWRVQKRGKELELKENALDNKEFGIDSSYHQIVGNSLSKERKILDDATKEASSILTNAKYVSTSFKDEVNKALQKMVFDTQKETSSSSNEIVTKHQTYLNQIAGKSLDNFQNITKKFEVEMDNEMKSYRTNLLVNLQKEIESYKQQKIKEADKTVSTIIQKVSQKVLNKSIPLEDHQKLIIESLEKCLKEGIFDLYGGNYFIRFFYNQITGQRFFFKSIRNFRRNI